MEKKCQKCLKLKTPEMFTGRRNTCRACIAAYLSEYHKTHPRPVEKKRAQRLKTLRKNWEKDELKRKARKMVWIRVAKGTMKRLPCQECGDPKSEAHHHDYSKPLDVIWLCRSHHMEIHYKERRKYV